MRRWTENPFSVLPRSSTMQDRHRQTDDQPPLPKRLAGDLTGLFSPPRPVPRDMDDDILFAARRHLAEARRTRRWGRIAVAAAAIALVFGLQHLMQPPRPLPNIQPPGADQTQIVRRQDIDRSGRVDILDAFALARMIRSGEQTQTRWDINGDGRVDQADVDAIANSAVRINGGAS